MHDLSQFGAGRAKENADLRRQLADAKAENERLREELTHFKALWLEWTRALETAMLMMDVTAIAIRDSKTDEKTIGALAKVSQDIQRVLSTEPIGGHR